MQCSHAVGFHNINSGDLCLLLFGKGSVSLLRVAKATFTVRVSRNIDFTLGKNERDFYYISGMAILCIVCSKTCLQVRSVSSREAILIWLSFTNYYLTALSSC
jgi:hypothetical protein